MFHRLSQREVRLRQPLLSLHPVRQPPIPVRRSLRGIEPDRIVEIRDRPVGVADADWPAPAAEKPPNRVKPAAPLPAADHVLPGGLLPFNGKMGS